MDQGLFKKYTLQIEKNKNLKEELCEYIQEKTTLVLEESEITLSKKRVTIQTTSVKRSFLLQKKIHDILLEKGYTVKI